MKIVNLISIDIESAAASDVANNAAKTRLEFHLFDFTLPPSLEIVIRFCALYHNRWPCFLQPSRQTANDIITQRSVDSVSKRWLKSTANSQHPRV